MQRGVIAFSERFLVRTKSLVAMAMVAVATLCFVGCGSDDVDNGGDTGGGSSVTISGNSEINVTSAGGEVVISFKTSASYTLSVDNTDMVKFKSGASGSAGQNKATLVISENTTQGERWAEVSITVSGYPKQKIFDIVQSYKVEVDNRDEVLKWMDERLRKEYYWMDIYSEAADGGKIDYELSKNYQSQGYSNPYSEFLDRSLLSLKGNEMDGSVDSQGKRRLYSNISRTSASSSYTRAASQVRGFGVVLYTILWLKQNPNVYAFPIQHVYPDSPADKAGLKRGDVIYEVNGTPLGDSNYSNAWYALNYGSSSSLSLGYKKVINDKAPITTVSLPLGSYYENPIACSKVLDVPAEMNPSGKKIGYLSYLVFDDAYDNDLVSSFTSFAAQGVEELILDLRFNGGGVVDSSTLLASMMLGEDKVGGVYAYLRRHKNNPYGDSTCNIIKNNPSTNQDLPNLGISRLWVITTEATASASEMVIQGLRGLDIPVHMIGLKTEGKNCGMDVTEKSAGSYVYTFAPITFMNYNAKEFNDYADGIKPDTDLEAWIADPKLDEQGNTLRDEDNKIIYEKRVSDYNVQLMINRFPIAECDWAVFENDGENAFDVAVHEAIMQINGTTAFTPAEEESTPTRAKATRYVEHVQKLEHKMKRRGGGSLYYGLQQSAQREQE